MKKPIDIEKLLQWAIRDELPKGQRVAASSWDVIEQFGMLGTKVQTSGFNADSFGMVPGEPDEDALVIAGAVRALEREARFDHLADVQSLFGEWAAIAGDAPGLLLMSTFDPAALVISCATQGTRPKWAFENPTPRQQFAQTATKPRPIVHGIDRSGEVMEIRPTRKTGKYPVTMRPRSPLLWHDPAPLHVGECRAEWVCWHGALNTLAAALSGKLRAYEPAPTTLPLMPWITGMDEPRILQGRDLSAVSAFDPRLAPVRNIVTPEPVSSPIEAQTAASYAKASRLKMKNAKAA
ncbi:MULTISPECIES: hypothetical protein [unclassified Bradyrhizobium]|uniref:hypothetical protein n=1 Tax=unclassified Bradyrhizobium TaxID=2631580 RepID=UPI0028E53EF3|nr:MULTISPECIES: hypothetical protein [unclassified Bradyrhizobium]